MPRRKRTSQIIIEAEQRASGLQAIDPNLDLGNGVTLAALRAAIEETKALLNQYNLTLAKSDGDQSQLEQSEEKLARLTSTCLRAVSVKFGPDSDAYEKAGGRRLSERRRPDRKAATESEKAPSRPTTSNEA